MMRTERQALQFFRGEGRALAGAGILLVLHTGLALLKPWPLAWVVDRLGGARDGWAGTWAGSTPGFLGVMAGLVVLLHGLHAVLGAWQQGVVIATGLRGLARVRTAVFGWLLRLSLPRLQGERSGDLIYRATWDTHAFQTLLTQGLFAAVGAGLSVLAMTLVMARLDGRLTLVALATVPILVAVMRAFGPRMGRCATEAQAADSDVAGGVQQTVAHLSLIQSFTREPAEAAHFASRVATALRSRWRQHRMEVVYLALVALVLAAGTAAIVWMGSRHVAAGRLSTGTLLVFVAYLFQLYEPLNQLSHVGSTVSQARAGAERVLDLLASDPGTPEPRNEAPRAALPSGPLALEFDRVCFAHVPGTPVLTDLSFRLEAGEAAALVGPSGAGKSTLLALIPRFLEPDSGSLRVGGQEVRDLSRTELRRHVALVLQESRLLPGTVAENIGIGREGASREAIESAARAAHADGFIRRLPQGYDTPVGEGAARLSLGEQQRIGIARAFLKDAPILLLDEPTSALDEASEAAVLEGLHALMRGRTVLLVTHRPTVWRGMPRVLRLEGGRLAEERQRPG